MKSFSAFFARKLKPSTLTPEGTNLILGEVAARTLEKGLDGFVISAFLASQKGEVMFRGKGNLASALAQALETLLRDPDTSTMANFAIIMALKAVRGPGDVQIVGDDECSCPACAAQRAQEEISQTTTH